MCMFLVGVKSWPWSSPTPKPEPSWPRHLDSPPGLLVSLPSSAECFQQLDGCSPCQFRVHGSRNEGIDNPVEG